MENTLENAIQFMNDRYGQDIEDILIAYASSVRPVVVLPSEREFDFDPWTNGWNKCIDELRHLNPDLIFTSPATTGDKSDRE